MSRVLIAFSILALCATAGCSSTPTAPSGDPVPLPLTRFTAGAEPLTVFSGVREPARRVIRDQATWRSTWTEIWRGLTPEPPMPDVDFTRDMVVLVGIGEQPTGGYTVLITSAVESSNGVTIESRTVVPGFGCGTPQVLTHPVDAVRVPRRDGAVAFTSRVETQTCS